MKRLAVVLPALALCALQARVSLSQQDLEPGVQTSPGVTPAAVPATGGAASTPSPTAAPKTGAKPSPAAVKPSVTATAAAAKGERPADRVDLNATQISGNRELPKVMYVVPWRKAELGDFAGRPPNSLLDEALTPIDRDVFKRQNRYFATLQQQAGPAKSQPDASSTTSAPPRPEDEK